LESCCQCHQHFTCSFYACRSQKPKKALWLGCIFVLLGSMGLKAALKMLMKLTPYLPHKREKPKCWSKNANSSFLTFPNRKNFLSLKRNYVTAPMNGRRVKWWRSRELNNSKKALKSPVTLERTWYKKVEPISQT